MSIGKILAAALIGAVVGSGATWATMKSTTGDASGNSLHKLYREPYSFMTGKQFLDTCVPNGISTYSPYEIDEVLRVATESQACWSFMEATMDTLVVMGATCQNLDRDTQIAVENVARREADERMSGAGAVVRALYMSGACVDRK